MNNKFILTWFLVFFCSINIFGQGKDYEVTASELNIREQDNKTSEVIGKLSKGQIIRVDTIVGDWALTSFADEQGVEKQGYISTEYIKSIEVENNKKPNSPTFYAVVGILAFSLICYIIALIKTHKGEMTTIVNWYDFALLAGSFSIPVIAFIMDKEDKNIMIGGIIIGGLCLLGSLVWSVVANKDNYFHAFLSVFAKIFIVSAMILIAILLIANVRNTHKRVRYSDGSYSDVPLNYYEQLAEDRRHQNTQNIILSIAGFLILSLIGSHLTLGKNKNIQLSEEQK